MYLAEAEYKVFGHGWGLNSSPGTPVRMPLVCNWVTRYTNADDMRPQPINNHHVYRQLISPERWE